MKLSIVTVSWNAAATIGDTLRSVAAQTGADIEHIVIDGGSRDDTMAIVGRFPHVARAVSEPDKGIYDAMNKGLALATGDAVGFLNSDDFFCRTDAAARIAAGLEASGADLVSGAVAIVARDDMARVRRHYRARGFQPWMLRFGHMPPHPAFYARREALVRAGGFDAGFRIAGDFELIVRLFAGGARLHTLDETLVGFRDGGASVDRRTMNGEILGALRRNGIASAPALLWARYPFKAVQLLRRPSDYHVPPWIG
ncbi:glycosyltransferase family 2 protein [Sphingomonas canadensis]|uniref:Glycosyltransferase family 2 protein n=1 Tax=Sphingomonas canadensis TaxID=1219257 RepID=A0ABW3H3U2_9SPHN|nr:glycosyltransferase family 2 protein [Sphingomonas canadensis]MCW3835395.1 glycosyltransferase [Sphingomonas canadensis]